TPAPGGVRRVRPGRGRRAGDRAGGRADVLSKGITIRAHKPTNSIFVRHYANDLERIKKLIREALDIPLPQVKIEARLNEINRTDLFEIGVQWGGASTARDGSNILVGQGFAPLGRSGPVDVVRQAGDVVSGSPDATGSSAGTQVRFEGAALRLDGTRTVVYEPNSVTRIKMKLAVADDSAGGLVNLGGGALVPTINKRRAETEVLVREGDTLVVGGITQRTDTETIRKIPVFGDIPVIGWLFKSMLTQPTHNH